MKILVRNLVRSTSENELKELFQEFGTVGSCTLVIDKVSGESKGFGFVEMANAREAKAAIQNLNYKNLGGNKIRVKKAEDKSVADPSE
ncbi:MULTISPECIES: RNA recognition motif domain-containing protein [Alteromonadaceae]|uniref:RNA recognition motif domain-containing protein n=1 Tax=Alteromonadaceae TaxID=72275 RepID=UPI001C096032|nr:MULTISPECIES: RNA-binding protein [Aliiglaciecola]MBU2877413.1 RNA-binding protein [Aliiglaciecola lipolytica]MDO6712835.1 RNA-binding protein [Aliiglaciecola sp. 2_MG-2023]MDO6753930.1 RNA-binding protein [Aliiglaciecola sp. 1_MG-2023]